VWLYLRFALSFRDVEDLLAERGIIVSYETIRRWVDHFGPMIAADLRRRRGRPHSTWARSTAISAAVALPAATPKAIAKTAKFFFIESSMVAHGDDAHAGPAR
jgi:hypothetical protein